MDSVFDVAIIGGGIAGFSLAHALSPHKSVVILESEDAFGYHATGRSAAEFAFRFQTPLVGKLAALSFPFLNSPPDGFCQTPLLKERGMMLIAPEEKQARLEEVYAHESIATDRLRRLTSQEVLARAPILNPAFFTSAFFDPDCWDIEVETLFQAYQRSAKAHGAIAHRKAELRHAHRSDGVWKLETGAGLFEAAMIVNASGAWADETAALCGAAPLGHTPLNRTVITVDLPHGIDWRSMPEVQEIDEDFYMKPDAGKLLLSPADENASAPCDAQPEEMGIAWAMHWVNEATTICANRPAHAWAGLRTYSPDRAPVIGFDVEVEGFFWLTGQGGFGIQTSPALSEFAAALVLGESPPEKFAAVGVTAAALSPLRFGET
ncbi:MAG: FAD-binding oxidoreductase [Rhizobiaceae bacterium]